MTVAPLLTAARAAVLIAVITMVVTEVAWRAWNHVTPWDTRNFAIEPIDMVRVHANAVYDDLLGWRLRSNIAADGFTTDAFGARPARALITSDPVLAVGDSFTAGSEVRDDESWPAQLEAMLGRTVYNPSSGAWGTDQIILQAARSTAQRALPWDAVVLGFLWSDILRTEHKVYGGANKPYYDLTADGVVLRNRPVPPFAGGPGEIGWGRALLGRSVVIVTVARALHWERLTASDPALSYRLANPGQGAEITCRLLRARPWAAPTVLLLMYGDSDMAPDQPKPAVDVAECARAAGITVIDTWDELAGLGVRERRTRFVPQPDGRIWGHPSRAGNHRLAEQVAAALR